MAPPIELTGVLKDYRGLRPLRIRDLTVHEREVVSLEGLDAAAAEVLTNLVTGATLPDTGSVRIFGEDTAAIRDGDAWLATLDRFGIVSDRAALVQTFTLRQNIAIALTLDVDPLAGDVAATVAGLAAEAGLGASVLDVAAGAASPSARFRARLARAVVMAPRILLAEHPTASVPPHDVAAVASDFFRVVRARGLSVLITSSDRRFTTASDRHEVFDPATGAFKPRRLRAWFSRH